MEKFFKEASYEVHTQTPSITDEMLEEAKSVLGIILRRHSKSLIVTEDLIRHFSFRIGDDNPLYTDPEYGKGTRWGGMIAPPTFLYLVDSTIVAPKLRGVQWIYSGTDWEWYKVVRPGDRISALVRYVDAVEKRGSHAGRMINQIGEILYRNQNDEIVAKAYGKTMRVPRAKAEGGLKYEPRLKRWSLEEIFEIWERCRRYKRRGGKPRYWEDVEEGEEMPEMLKGPLRHIDIIWGGIMAGEGENTAGQGSHVYQLLHRRRHPADTYIDPETGVQDHPHRGHWEEFMAREVGMPGVYDVGTSRISWLAHFMTDWIGDDGFLKKLNVILRRPNVVGDLTILKGRVKRKFKENDEYLVECEIWAENQLGEVTAQGSSVVSLPARSG